MIATLCALAASAAAADRDDEDLDDLDNLEDDEDRSDGDRRHASEEEDLDDVDLELRGDEPGDVPYRHVGLTVTTGFATGETPFTGDVSAAIGVRPRPGLRIDAKVGAWLGTAYLVGTGGRVLPIAVPRVGLGVAYEASTSGAARPWVGVGVDLAVMMSDPVAVGPVATGRFGVDVGRRILAWSVWGEAGAVVCPALPALAGPTYRAVAPVAALHTGPSVRL